MEQCFRIALWMFVLIGCLQAKPVDSKPSCLIKPTDLGFELLAGVSCENQTFTFPTNVEGICLTEALTLFQKGLERAETNCKDEDERVGQALLALEFMDPMCFQHTNCNFTMTVHEQFAGFVKATETFVKQFNDYQKS